MAKYKLYGQVYELDNGLSPEQAKAQIDARLAKQRNKTDRTMSRNLRGYNIANTALGSLAASGNCFIWPADRAQKDFLRAASFGPGLSLVTAVFSLLPGLARRYAATPFCVMPAPDFVGL